MTGAKHAWGLPVAAVACLVAMSACAAPEQHEHVEVVILNVSDWHGQLDPVNGVGGAAILSSYFKAERANASGHVLTLAAGDSVGATPPLSSFFEDKPAVLAMNLMGFDADALGNHNFDSGVSRMRQLSELAAFPFLAANLHGMKEELPRVEPWRIIDIGGAKVGVVGLLNEETPMLTKPGSLGNMTIASAERAAATARDEMRAAGADALVIIIHKGVDGKGNGPLVDFARNVTGYDLILGDHTNAAFEARINGALVVENPSKGIRYARTTLLVDPDRSRVVNTSVAFVVPKADGVDPDPAIERLLAPYRLGLAPELDKKLTVANGPVPRAAGNGPARDGPMGDLLADAMRAAAGTQIALTNHGGTRSGLPTSYAPLDGALRRDTPPFDIVRGDVYVVQPFANALVSGSVTGATLWDAVEHGLTLSVPEISGIRVAFDSTRPPGSRVVSITLDGPAPACSSAGPACDLLPRGPAVPRDTTRYSFVTNDFVAQGGDGYKIPGLGASGSLVTEALIEHLSRFQSIEARSDGRLFDISKMR